MKDHVALSLNERNCILEALKADKRMDGRRLHDLRAVKLYFRQEYGAVEALYGKTRVFATVTAEVVEPWLDRPTEGFFSFNVEFSPMANPTFEPSSRPSPYAIEVARIIERSLKDSKAIDTEALCILAGEKVWSVRTDVRVLDDSGNLIDCCALATIAALLHFRRPDVTVCGNDVTIHQHSLADREPVPLSIHHVPFCVTFGFIGDDNVVIIDPEFKEEQIMNGRMTLTMNVHQELCGLQKGGGTAITATDVISCVKLAAAKTDMLNSVLQTTLEQFWNSRKRKRTVIPVGMSQIPEDPASITKKLPDVSENNLWINSQLSETPLISSLPSFNVSTSTNSSIEKPVTKKTKSSAKSKNPPSSGTVETPAIQNASNTKLSNINVKKDSPVNTQVGKLDSVVAEWASEDMIMVDTPVPNKQKTNKKKAKKVVIDLV